MPFLISEDEALKKHLQGMTVTDQNDNARKVEVYFRLPEPEERRITYPFVTIDLIDIDREEDREHRGLVELDYLPDGYDVPPTEPGSNVTEFPVPVSLMYQVTTYTRSAWHDRYLHAQMLTDKLPFRFGALEVPADNTIRRLDFLGWDQSDQVDANGKRVFRKAYTIAVSSEMYPYAIVRAAKVASVSVTTYHQLEPFIVDQDVA